MSATLSVAPRRPSRSTAGGRRSLRFCMVTTFYPPYNFGGDGIGIQRLAQGLVRRGHHVTVIHDVDAYRALAGGPDPAEEAPDGVERIGLRSGVGPVSPLLTQQTGRPVVNGRRIRRLLDRGRYDVINFHNISLVGGPGILAAGDALKLYMAHEHWLVCPTHVLWRHDREPCDGRECVRCTLRHHRPPQLWRHTGRLERELRHVDAFIAMSEFSRAKHREFGFPRDMEVLPYFLPDVAPAGADADPAPVHPRPYFLIVARLERIKGIDTVIPLFKEDRGVDLVIAGDGKEAGALRNLADGNPRVRFVGRVPTAQLHRYYRDALALIMPSAGYETFGITLIEAFRQSTPVIARRMGPFPEIVERCGGGLLFGSPDELVAAMNRLRSEPGLRDRLGEAGRRGFVSHWSEAAVLPGYLEIVRGAARSSGRAQLAAALAGDAEVAA